MKRDDLKTRLLALCLKLGIGLTSSSNMQTLQEDQAELFLRRNYMDFTSKFDPKFWLPRITMPSLSQFAQSKAQLHQDLVALGFLDYMTGGYFVEFGATDGVRFSNTYLLEKHYQWTGILAEPGRVWHKSLTSNRSAIVETRCVWRTSGEKLEFNETVVGELSTLEMFSAGDMHAAARLSGNRYLVDTISLEDLLGINQAPERIDYLSIDTEGSEFEILRDFDFSKYSFGFISCEHNFTPSRDQVFKLLSANGYVRVLESMSLFDDWYVHNSLVKTE